MRSVLSWIVRLYFGIGLVLGVMLFASHTMQSALAAPETDVLVKDAAVGAIRGGLRVFYWAPSAYEHVVVREADPLNWVIN
tara:strand:- start:1014 stop:1256 length:243 start_codon:yes stop_codon:yes gene_type:complete